MAEGLSIGTLTGSLELEDLLSPALDKAKEKIKEAKEYLSELGPAGEAAAKQLGLVAGAAGILVGAAAAAGGAILALGEKGSVILGVEQAFDRLAVQAGSTGDALRDALMSGVKGTVDDFDLMKTTSNLLSSGLKVTADQFELMGKVSRELGKATGTDATQGLELMSGALLTGRTRGLQHAGILVNLKDAEETFAHSLGTTKDALTDLQKREADRIEILRASQEWLDRVGVSELTFKERIQQAHAAVDDWMDSLMKGIATSPVLAAALDGIGNALKAAFGGTTDDLLKGILNIVDDIAIGLIDMAIAGTRDARDLYAVWSGFKAIILGIETAVVAVAAALANVALAAERAATRLHIVDGKDVAMYQDAAAQLTAMRDSLADQTKEAGRAATGISDFDKRAEAAAATLTETRDKMEKLKGSTAAAADATKDFVGPINQANDSAGKLSKTVQALVDAWTGEGKKVHEIEQAFAALSPSQKASYDVQMALIPVIQKLIESHHGVSTAMMTEYDAALKSRDAVIQHDSAMLHAAKVTSSMIDAQRDLGRSDAEIAAGYGVTTAGLKKYEAELKTSADIVKLNSVPALKDFSSKLQDLGSVVPQKFFDDMGKIAESLDKVEQRSYRVQFGFKGMTEELKNVGTAVVPTANELNNFAAFDFTGPVETLNDKLAQTEKATSAITTALGQMGQAAGGNLGIMLVGLSSVTAMLTKYFTVSAEGQRGMTGRELGTQAGAVGLGVIGNVGLSSGSTAGMIAGGAATGASVGMTVGSVVPGLGTAAGAGIGAGVGAIAGWIASMKEWHKVTNDLSRDFAGIHISEDLAKAIDEIEKTSGLARTQATLTQLDKIVAEAGGLSAQNLDMFTGKLHDVFSMIEMKSMSASQATQILDKNFADFAAHSTSETGLLSKEMQEIINLDTKFGTNSAAVSKYVLDQMNASSSGISSALKVTSDAYDERAKLQASLADQQSKMSSVEIQDLAKVADLRAKLAKESDPAKRAKELDDIKKIDDAWQGTAQTYEDTTAALKVQDAIIQITGVHSQQSASAIAASITGTVDANMKAGASFIDAVRSQIPAVEALQKQLDATGYDGGAAFDFLRKEVQLATDPIAGPALQAIEGYTAGLVGMQNAGKMNEEQFAGIAGQIGATEQALEAQGFTSDQVLPAMQKDLQTIWQMQKDYGYTVDDATQALIDQGVQSGLIGEKQQSVEQKTLDVLMAIADALGAKIPDGLEAAAKATETQADRMNDALKDIKMPDLKPVDVVIHGHFDIDDPAAAMSTGGRVQYRAGGGNILPFAPRGTDTVPAMLTPGEGVVTTRGMGVLGDEGLNSLNRGESAGDPATERLRDDMKRFMSALPNTLARAVRDEVQKVQRRR